MNLDDCPERAEQFGIVQVPPLVWFDHGTPIERFAGLSSPQELRGRLRGVLADYATASRR